MQIIQYKGVSINQDEQNVLRDLDFTVEEGEFIYLLGRVGCGKSTLMKTLYGELPIASGEARLLDFDLSKLRYRQIPMLRRKIGMVFQDFQLLTDRTVEDNLRFVLQATGWKDRTAMDHQIHDVLEQVGMQTKGYKMPHQLSGGEQQRIVIARALLNSPAIILADEPTGNLDPETGKEIMELLSAIQQAGTTIIMATHNPRWPKEYPGRNFLFEDRTIKE